MSPEEMLLERRSFAARERMARPRPRADEARGSEPEVPPVRTIVLDRAPVAVAPLRESAIVVISGWGTFRLKEAVNRRDAGVRIGLAVVVVIGAVLLAAEG